MITKGYAAPEVQRAYARAHALCSQVGETTQLLPVLRGLAAFYYVRAEYQTALALAEQCLALAQRLRDPALLLEAHSALGSTLFFLGACQASRAHCEHGIALYEPQHAHAHAARYGQDPGMGCLSYAALGLWLLGYPEQAVQQSLAAISLGERLAHPFSQARTLTWAAILAQFRRTWAAGKVRAQQAIALADGHGFPRWEAVGRVLGGWAVAMQGDGEDGLALLQQGLQMVRATGGLGFQPYFLALQAEVYDAMGRTEAGLASIAEGLSAGE